MNRIERLTAILLYLQGGKRTAGEIAAHFEVSRRTILRDIGALSEMGIPIGAELGATGGYTLPPDYTLPPLALTLNEALLLRLALSALSGLADTPHRRERDSLLAKVQTLLPRGRQADLARLEPALSLDTHTRPYPTPFLDRLLTSAHEERWVTVVYRSERGESAQTLLPTRLRTADGLWYCEAYSHERGETRVYRVDRFLDVQPAAVAPPVAAPDTAIAHIHPTYPEVRITLTARGLLRLEREPYLSRHVQRTATGTGTLVMRLRPAEYDWLIGILAPLGGEARVLAPEELRASLRSLAQDLADLYAEG